jgi:predicted nuclease of predicted toxin-antitoxin system
MDHHVRRAVTEGLRRRGVDVLTAYQDGFAGKSDERLLERSTQLGRVLFTHDEDFLAIAHHWLLDGREFAGIVYVHQDELPNRKMIDDLELIAKAADPKDTWNRVEFLPL